MDPASLRYAKTHEWVNVDGDVATVGISNFAVEQLTDLVYVGLPDVGRTLAAGENFGEVESVKAVSDLYSPVAGEVTEVNEAVSDDPAILSEEPYGRGWMIKLKIADPAGLDSLMDQTAYESHCAASDDT